MPSHPQIDLRYPIRVESYTAQERNDALEGIRQLPQSLRSAVAPLSEEQLDTPYRPGGWTVRQLVHHVADSHMNAYVRVRLALTEDCPTIIPYQETLWAELNDARSAAVSTSLDLLQALHTRWAQLFASLREPDWKRRYVHPENGSETLERVVVLYDWHGRPPHRTRHLLVCAHGLVAAPVEIRQKPEISPTELARSLEQFFLNHPRAALLEDGRVLFEMAAAHYSISAEHGRCVLHLWSEERNMVRTVVGLEARKENTAPPRAAPWHPAPAIARGVKRSRSEDARNPRPQQEQVSAAAGAGCSPATSMNTK